MRFKVLGGWDFFGRNSESPRYQSFLDWISFQVSTFLREEATYCLHFSVATKQIKPQGGFGCNVKQQPKGCWKGTRGEDRAEVPYTPRLVCLIMINHGDSGGNFVHVSHIYVSVDIQVDKPMLFPLLFSGKLDWLNASAKSDRFHEKQSMSWFQILFVCPSWISHLRCRKTPI